MQKKEHKMDEKKQPTIPNGTPLCLEQNGKIFVLKKEGEEYIKERELTPEEKEYFLASLL